MSNLPKKRGFLMVNYDTPDFILDIHNNLNKDDLYFEHRNNIDYGIEDETHISVGLSLDNDTNLDELKKYLDDISKYKAILCDISVFEREEFDVLKCSVISSSLKRTNKEIQDNFKNYCEFPTYNPHVTIAYFKKGCAEKYAKKELPKLYLLQPKYFTYSYYDENGEEISIKFEK